MCALSQSCDHRIIVDPDLRKTRHGQDHCRFGTFRYRPCVLRLLIACGLFVPKMKDLRGTKPIFPYDAAVMQTQDEISIFMPPSNKRLIKAIHPLKVRTPNTHVAAAYALPGKRPLNPSKAFWQT